VDECLGRGTSAHGTQEVAEQGDLAIEAGSGQDLGRHGTAARDAVVEALFLDGPGDALVVAG
jgi:hypothetical protein